MPAISILLASYGEQSQRYLDLCFHSLEMQSFQDFELIHVSSGEFKPHSARPYNSRATKSYHEHSTERLHFPSAISLANELSDKSSNVILLLNDDVIMQKDCLKLMYDIASTSPVIVNPKSNCDDNGRFYFSPTPFHKVQYRIDEMESLFADVINFNENQQFLLVKQPQVHFYCTAMQRKIWDSVGGIDTNLKTGWDDADFCLRARNKGYQSVIAMHAYALHGSGVSADIHLTQEDRVFNEKYFMEKHK